MSTFSNGSFGSASNSRDVPARQRRSTRVSDESAATLTTGLEWRSSTRSLWQILMPSTDLTVERRRLSISSRESVSKGRRSAERSSISTDDNRRTRRRCSEERRDKGNPVDDGGAFGDKKVGVAECAKLQALMVISSSSLLIKGDQEWRVDSEELEHVPKRTQHGEVGHQG